MRGAQNRSIVCCFCCNAKSTTSLAIKAELAPAAAATNVKLWPNTDSCLYIHIGGRRKEQPVECYRANTAPFYSKLVDGGKQVVQCGNGQMRWRRMMMMMSTVGLAISHYSLALSLARSLASRSANFPLLCCAQQRQVTTEIAATSKSHPPKRASSWQRELFTGQQQQRQQHNAVAFRFGGLRRRRR